jgi:hypothetical protein
MAQYNDPSRHLGRKPTDESKPLWKKPKPRKKTAKKKVRTPGMNHTPNAYTAKRASGIVIVEPSMLYTLDEARAILAEEELAKFTNRAKGSKGVSGHPARPRTRPNLHATSSFKAPRKCVSGLNWVAWMTWLPYGWDDD